MSFAALFPDADFRHHLSVKRGDLERFFAPTAEHDSLLAERRRWLRESPGNYIAANPEAAPLIDETAEVLGVAVDRNGDLLGRLSSLGAQIEPDIVLLQKTADGIFRVVAGCVCFPSSWSLPEKLDLRLDQVHSVVPDLNATIGAPISKFLGKMQPGAAWERSNWGVSASWERNQHPSRHLPRLTPPLDLDRVYFRVEDQVLSILPATGGLLFGIRIVTEPLQRIVDEEPVVAAGLVRALATMPEEMARYKHLGAVRAELVELLQRATCDYVFGGGEAPAAGA